MALLPLVLACGTTPGERWRALHPDFERQPPASGQSLAEAVASLEEPKASHSITVSDTRLLAVGPDPWQPLDPETALELGPEEDELHAVIALRTCRHRSGVRRTVVPRASWLLFRGGRLDAFDHWEFGEGCAPEHRLQPATEAERRLERELSRDVARRHPGNRLDAAGTFRKGLVLLEHGRIEDADAMLELGERELDKETHAADEELPDAPSETELMEARALRAELEDALRRARGIPEDPEERFWKGREGSRRLQQIR